MRRVLICGDRHWLNSELILRCVQKANKAERIDLIIEGEARGADIMGRHAAEACGIPVAPYPAKWDKLGRRAGPVRNQLMLDEGKPTEVWAFHDHLEQSKGTLDMINRCRKAGIPGLHIYYGGFVKI